MLIKGEKFNFNGEEMEVPPLPFGDMPFIMPRMVSFEKLDTKERLELIGDFVFACLKRNYPDLERARFDNELLGSDNYEEAFIVALRVSRLTKKVEDDAGNRARLSSSTS